MQGSDHAETNEELYNRAKKLFVERGYEEVTMKELAKEVGWSEKQLVRRFGSKGDFVIELMMEGFSLEEEENDPDVRSLNTNKAVADIVYDYIMTRLNRYLIFGKKLFKEMMTWSLSLAKKNPEMMNKFVQMDFMFVDDLITFLDGLKENGVLETEFDSVQAGEIVYSVLAFEFLVYIYQSDHTKDQLHEGIQKKLHFIFT